MTESTYLTAEQRSEIVGREFPSATADIEKGHLKRFAEAIGDDNPLWNDELAARSMRYGGLIAPPTFLRILRGVHLIASIGLPDLRGVKVLPKAGHWIQQERPAETNAALIEFLGSLK